MLIAVIVLQVVVIALLVVITRLVNQLDTNLRFDPTVPLQEVQDALSTAARLAAKVNADLDINVAEARQQFSRLVVLLDRLQIDVTASSTADALVASNLDSLQEQAREMETGDPGAVADAAAGGVIPPKIYRKRRR